MALHCEAAATFKLQELALLSDSTADNIRHQWLQATVLHMGMVTNDELTEKHV